MKRSLGNSQRWASFTGGVIGREAAKMATEAAERYSPLVRAAVYKGLDLARRNPRRALRWSAVGGTVFCVAAIGGLIAGVTQLRKARPAS
jgi:hypothetical protein